LTKIFDKFDRKDWFEYCKLDPTKFRCPKCGGVGSDGIAITNKGVIYCIRQVWYKEFKQYNQCRGLIFNPSAKQMLNIEKGDL
jgi:hypothetical protein